MDRPRKKYTVWVWVLATIVIGASAASTVYNAGQAVIAFVALEQTVASLPKEAIAQEKVASAALPEKNMGSDDASGIASTTEVVDGHYYFLKDGYSLPRTSALAYLAGDIDTGEIIIEKNPGSVLPIASVSKLITSLVSLDVIPQKELITVSRSSVNTYGKSGGLGFGEKILAEDLLYPLLIESSNDAAPS